MPLRFRRESDGTYAAEVPYRGRDLLCNSLVNKGTAFSREERRAFGLEGMLPADVTTIEQQIHRVYGNITRKNDPLERYIGMVALQDRNETLFYRLLLDHIEELMPIVYTPTVGQACKSFSRIFRRGRGLWLTPDDAGRIDHILGNADSQDVRLIVVTDNERILGLGDQGAGGMGIPIGKLALYTAAAGIHPSQTLPVSLDVGTDNEDLLNDELYVGWRQPRLRGPRYDALVEEFVQAVKRRFPAALLQWEDFKKTNAINLLARYRGVLPSFNDDIQGTAAVGLAGVIAASRAMDVPLKHQRVVMLGAGAAGIGIGHQIRDALGRAGLAGDALTRAIAVLDSKGMLLDDGTDHDAHKREFAWPLELARAEGLDLDGPLDLLSVVTALKPTVLIGTSGQPGAFSEDVVRAMAQGTPRPAIFPFSNPTSKAEARPSDIIQWTAGKALVATGSPFAAVEYRGERIAFGQGNNVYVFPGVGLGVLVSRAREVTDSMFTVAAKTLADSLSVHDLTDGLLYPPLTQLRKITRRIAEAVVREANSLGVGEPVADDQVPARVAAAIWTPAYPALIPV